MIKLMFQAETMTDIMTKRGKYFLYNLKSKSRIPKKF